MGAFRPSGTEPLIRCYIEARTTASLKKLQTACRELLKAQMEMLQPARMRYFNGMKVLTAEEKFVTDTNGQRVGVLLDLQTYERLRGAEEELSDIRACDAARPKIAAEMSAGDFTTLAGYRTRRSSRRS